MHAMGMLAALVICSVAAPAIALAEPVAIQIQVIEAQRNGKEVDPRIRALHRAFDGYKGAQLADEIETKVEVGASVSLQILNRKQMLRVTVTKVEPDGTIKLKVAIDAFKFESDTTHKKGNATVVVGHPTGEDSAIFLAVTPRIAAK